MDQLKLMVVKGIEGSGVEDYYQILYRTYRPHVDLETSTLSGFINKLRTLAHTDYPVQKLHSPEYRELVELCRTDPTLVNQFHIHPTYTLICNKTYIDYVEHVKLISRSVKVHSPNAIRINSTFRLK